jgi:hypothetical protein
MTSAMAVMPVVRACLREISMECTGLRGRAEDTVKR